MVTFILTQTNKQTRKHNGQCRGPQKWSCPYIVQYRNYHDRPALLYYYEAYPSCLRDVNICVVCMCVCFSLRSCQTEMQSVWECYMSLRRRLRSCAVRTRHLQACADTCLMDSIPWWETQISCFTPLSLSHTFVRLHYIFFLLYIFYLVVVLFYLFIF